MRNLSSKSSRRQTEPIRLFYSYSHKDKGARDTLDRSLRVFEEQGLIRSWIDRHITAGSKWSGAIRENLEASDLIVLMISKNFVESEWCINEMQYALERQRSGDARVVPIIVGAVDWSAYGFDNPGAELQVLPRNRPPINEWKNHEKHEAWLEIADEISDVIGDLIEERQRDRKALADIKPKKFDKDSLLMEDLRDGARTLYDMVKRRDNFNPDLLIASNQGGMITAAIMNKELGKPVGIVHSAVSGHKRVVKHISLPYEIGGANENGGKNKITPSNILVVDTKLKTAESAVGIKQVLLNEYGPDLDIRYAIVLSYGGWKPSLWQTVPSHPFDWPIRFRAKNLQAYIAYYTDCEPKKDTIMEEYRPGSRWSK